MCECSSVPQTRSAPLMRTLEQDGDSISTASVALIAKAQMYTYNQRSTSVDAPLVTRFGVEFCSLSSSFCIFPVNVYFQLDHDRHGSRLMRYFHHNERARLVSLIRVISSRDAGSDRMQEVNGHKTFALSKLDEDIREGRT